MRSMAAICSVTRRTNRLLGYAVANRTAIVDLSQMPGDGNDALLALYREGHHDAGAADVAARAGVSVRTVFRLFDDLDSLVEIAIERAASSPKSRGGDAPLPSAEVDRLRAEAAKFPDLTVRFFGNIPDEELSTLYDRADIFAMTSINHRDSVEGFGLVYLEAAAHGLPIIAHDVGGVREAGYALAGLGIGGIAVALAALAKALAPKAVEFPALALALKPKAAPLWFRAP